MVHKLIVQTEKGRSDSLRHPVKIAFTFTPVESKRPTLSYSPVARWVTIFAFNSQESVCLEWDSIFKFEVRKQLVGVIEYAEASKSIPPGHALTMGYSSVSNALHWSPPWPYDDHVAFKQCSVMAVNNTGSTQHLVLDMKVPSSRFDVSIVAYGPLVQGGQVVAPSDLMLQAYIVTDNVTERTILQPQDLTRPIFTIPISCEDLPASSTWRLSQGHNGEIQLKNVDLVGWNPNPSTAETKRLLDMFVKSLDETQKRLSVLEASVGRAHDCQAALVASQQLMGSLFRIQDQVAGLDQRALAIESKTEGLETALSQTQDQRTSLQRSLPKVEQRSPAVRPNARELENSSQTQQDLSAAKESLLEAGYKLAGLDLRVVDVETRMGQLAETLCKNQERFRQVEAAGVLWSEGGVKTQERV